MLQAGMLQATSPIRRNSPLCACLALGALAHRDVIRCLLLFAGVAIIAINATHAQQAWVSLEGDSHPARAARRHQSHIGLWQAYARSINATADESLFAQIHNDLEPFRIAGGIRQSLVIEKVCGLKDVACFTINRQGVNHTFSKHAGKLSQLDFVMA